MPRFRIAHENVIVSDVCIWCGKALPDSRAHLFPKCLGGRFWAKICCGPCNFELGSKWEAQVDMDAFLTAALVKLGMKSKSKAYRKARKVDTDTGFEMQIGKDGLLKPIPRDLPDGSFLGHGKDALNKWQTKLPHWPIDKLTAFLMDPQSTVIHHEGESLRKKNYSAGKAEVRLEGLRGGPNTRMTLKIAYEFCMINTWMDAPCIRDFFEGALTVQKDRGKISIRESDRANQRIFSGRNIHHRKVKVLESIDFQPYHALALKLSKDLILYLELRYFGAVADYIIFDKIDWLPDKILPWLDVYCFFGTQRAEVEFVHLPYLHNDRWHLQVWTDELIRNWYHEIPRDPG